MKRRTSSTDLHSPSTRHTRVSYVGTILTMGLIVHHRYRLSMRRNRATIKTLVIIIIHKIHRVFLNNIFAVITFDNHQPQEIPEVTPFVESKELIETNNELYTIMEDFMKRMNQQREQEALLVAQREQEQEQAAQEKE
ncbi:hypothetical protein Tco_0412818 [Tanacetum coccineum]